MTMSQELFKTTLENGIKRRMPITWGIFSCLEQIDAETVAVVITASAKGNYLYTTKVPMSNSDEHAIEIGSDEEDEHCRMFNYEDFYIYKLRVNEQTETDKCTPRRNSRMFLPRPGLITSRASTHEIWDDDADLAFQMILRWVVHRDAH